MSNLFRKIKTRIITNIKNFALFLRFILKKPQHNTSQRKVYVDLSNPRLERYYYLLLKFFDLAGYQVNVRFNPWLLLNLRNYSDLIYNLESLKIVFSPPAGYDLWLTEKKNLPARNNALFVDVNYFTRKKTVDEYVFPYNMHPDIYDSGLYKALPALRKVEKSIKVFFGGNTGFGYGNPDIPQLFGKITRNEIADCLEAFPYQDRLTDITTKEKSKLLVSNEFLSLVTAKKPFFALEDWWRVLAQSIFYIAAPGFSMPFSHNVIEAMAVGTIPILEYPEMFNPPLTDKINCLRFDGESDLTEKVTAALEMDAEKTAIMREAVLKYYDENLKPEAAVENLFEHLPSIKKLYLNAEHISLEKLKKEISQNGKS